jgi:hypothetical protein
MQLMMGQTLPLRSCRKDPAKAIRATSALRAVGCDFDEEANLNGDSFGFGQRGIQGPSGPIGPVGVCGPRSGRATTSVDVGAYAKVNKKIGTKYAVE